MAERARSGMVTGLFTDLVGSTELMGRLGETAFDHVRRHHFAMVRAQIEAHGGAEVKNTGDGMMATFDSAVGAVRVAVATQLSARSPSRTGNAGPAGRIDCRTPSVGFAVQCRHWGLRWGQPWKRSSARSGP